MLSHSHDDRGNSENNLTRFLLLLGRSKRIAKCCRRRKCSSSHFCRVTRRCCRQVKVSSRATDERPVGFSTRPPDSVRLGRRQAGSGGNRTAGLQISEIYPRLRIFNLPSAPVCDTLSGGEWVIEMKRQTRQAGHRRLTRRSVEDRPGTGFPHHGQRGRRHLILTIIIGGLIILPGSGSG